MSMLFITRKFPPSTGGMQNFAHDLYGALSKTIDVKLIKWGRSNKYLPFVLPYFVIKASAMLIKDDIEIIHMQDGVLAPLGWLLSKLFKKPYTVVIHGLDITHSNNLYQVVVPKCVARADAVFCISQAAAQEAANRGVPMQKIHVITPGISDNLYGSKTKARRDLHEKLGIDEDAVVLLTVGRLVKRKGVAWFIDSVLPKLIKLHPKTVYLVVGAGEEQEHIEEAAKHNKLSKHVRLLGQVSDEERKMVYNGSDIFIQPNIVVPGDIEGFGLVVLEASLCELPVIATGIEGIKDALADGKNGVLVDKPKDTKAFVEAIEPFLKGQKPALTFGKKSREYTLKNFDWETIASKYTDVYKSIIKPNN